MICTEDYGFFRDAIGMQMESASNVDLNLLSSDPGKFKLSDYYCAKLTVRRACSILKILIAG